MITSKFKAPYSARHALLLPSIFASFKECINVHFFICFFCTSFKMFLTKWTVSVFSLVFLPSSFHPLPPPPSLLHSPSLSFLPSLLSPLLYVIFPNSSLSLIIILSFFSLLSFTLLFSLQPFLLLFLSLLLSVSPL